RLELHYLGIDQDHAQIVRSLGAEERSHDAVDAHGFPRTRLAGDEKMRGAGQIHHIGLARYGLAQADFQGIVLQGELGRPEDFLDIDDLGLAVGDFDSDYGLAGNGRQDADAFGAQGQGQIVGKGADAADLDPGRELDLVTRNHGTRTYLRDLAHDLEVDELILEQLRLLPQFLFGELQGLRGRFVENLVRGRHPVGIVNDFGPGGSLRERQGRGTEAFSGFLFPIAGALGIDVVAVRAHGG